MNIQIEVTGGTHRLVHATLHIEGENSGTISVERSCFTKMCDLLMNEKYSIVKNP